MNRSSFACFPMLRALFLPVGMGLLLVGACAAQSTAALSPEQIATNASWNELHANQHGQTFRYRLHKSSEVRSSTKLIAETRDGDVARLIATGDRPLSDETNQAELERLRTLRNDPSLQEHRQKREQADAARAEKIIRLLPQAFTFQLLDTVPGPSGPCYRLAFTPNPKFSPPDREAEVLHGMAGELWVDKAQQRMVKLDAHLVADVDFGWGIVGKLQKGGTILVEQKEIGGHQWKTAHLQLDLTGKILMMKQLKIHTTEDASDFQPIPDEGYQAAIDMLTSLPLQ